MTKSTRKYLKSIQISRNLSHSAAKIATTTILLASGQIVGSSAGADARDDLSANLAHRLSQASVELTRLTEEVPEVMKGNHLRSFLSNRLVAQWKDWDNWDNWDDFRNDWNDAPGPPKPSPDDGGGSPGDGGGSGDGGSGQGWGR